MNSSFILLSSVSPKIVKDSNAFIHKKVPTLLALKKNVRKSSNFDNVCPPVRLRESLVVIESSTESTSSVELLCNVINEIPIVIPDSDDDKLDGEDKVLLSQTKYLTITDWVNNVNVQLCSEKQTDLGVYDFKDVLSSLPKGVDEKSVDVVDNVKGFSSTSSSDSVSSDDSNKYCSDVLKELYNDTWKHIKNDVLPKSTPRRKKLNPSVNRSKTDVKLKVQTNICKTPASPWFQTLKGLCDSDMSDVSSTNELKKPTRKLSFDSDRSSSSSHKSANKKKQSDTLSDLSDELTTKAKTKTKGTENGKTKGKAAVKTKDTNKKPTKAKDNGKRESLSLDRSCFYKITPIKQKCSSIHTSTKSFLASLSGAVPLIQCDPTARLFRNNFKEYKDELLNRLFKLYNETVFDNQIPDDTLFEWNDRMRGTAGFCYCRKVTRRTGVIERKARIVFSTKVVDSSDRLRDTLIHELCHAATWIVNEVANGHGDYWKAWSVKAQRCFPELPPIKRCHDYVINTKYTYRCMDCGYSIGRHSKSLDTDRKRCGHCYGKFEVLINKTSKSGETTSVPATLKKAPTAFALFVKEHYATYRTPQLNHGQVMKLLGQKFNEAKVPL